MIKCGRGSTNPQKMQRKTATNTLWYGESSTLQASVFMGKNYSDNWQSIKNAEDLTTKQMFDISEKLITEQADEIYGMRYNSLGTLFMEAFVFGWWWTSHQFLTQKSFPILRFCIVIWKDEREPTITFCMGRQMDVVQKFIRIQNFGQNWWWANGIRVNIFTGFTTLQLCHKVQELLSRLSVTPEKFTGRIIFMSMFNDIAWGSKDKKKRMRVKCSTRLSLHAKRFGAGQLSFLGPGSQKKWYSISDDSPQGEWDRIAEQMMLTFAESKSSVQRSA